MVMRFLILLLPSLVTCFSEENIHLEENEVAAAIQTCKHQVVQSYEDFNPRPNRKTFDKNNQYPSEDSDGSNLNFYNHERRSSGETINQNNNSRITENNFRGYNIYGQTHNYTPSTYFNHFVRNTSKRIKRSKEMNSKTDQSDQCFNQCVFANLHVDDDRGIPHQNKLWKKIEATIKVQKSRDILENQLRTCFHKLRNEAVDDVCSFSNKLERCLKLRFLDRINRNRQNQKE